MVVAATAAARMLFLLDIEPSGKWCESPMHERMRDPEPRSHDHALAHRRTFKGSDPQLRGSPPRKSSVFVSRPVARPGRGAARRATRIAASCREAAGPVAPEHRPRRGAASADHYTSILER